MAAVSDTRTPNICLYTWQQPECNQVSITLEELGLSYETRPIDFSKGIHRETWFLSINPSGRIPALTDTFTDGQQICLSEPANIIQYLVERYDTEYRISYAKGSRESYEVNKWLYFANGGICSMQDQASHFARYVPRQSPYSTARFQRETIYLYRILENHLASSKSPYLVGDKCTIADIAHWGYATLLTWAGIDIDGFPNIKAWEEQMIQRPGVEKGRHVPTPHVIKDWLNAEVVRVREMQAKHKAEIAELKRAEAEFKKKTEAEWDNARVDDSVIESIELADGLS